MTLTKILYVYPYECILFDKYNRNTVVFMLHE